MHKIVQIDVFGMYESCERWTYYTKLTTDEGYSMTPSSHRTGSVYTNHEGLSRDEARDRALSDAHEWGDFLGIPVEPFIEDGVTYEPSFVLESYTTRRLLLKERNENGKADD